MADVSRDQRSYYDRLVQALVMKLCMVLPSFLCVCALEAVGRHWRLTVFFYLQVMVIGMIFLSSTSDLAHAEHCRQKVDERCLYQIRKKMWSHGAACALSECRRWMWESSL